jgi:hypothetical protein
MFDARTFSLRAIEQFAEDERNLFFDDAGTVILHTDFVFIFADGFDMHPDFGQDTAFFAGIVGVIDGFFDGGEQCFSWVIEAEQMPVLSEKLADGYFFL